MSAQPRTLTPEELRVLFPRASASTIAANVQTAADLLLTKDAEMKRRGEERQASYRKTEKRSRPAKPKTMNQTERVFHEMLLKRMADGEFLWLAYEAVTLTVGDHRCRYTPDFAAVTSLGRLVFFETKGPFVRDDAAVKFKAAARQFPEFRFELWQRARVKDGGNWRQLL